MRGVRGRETWKRIMEKEVMAAAAGFARGKGCVMWQKKPRFMARCFA